MTRALPPSSAGSGPGPTPRAPAKRPPISLAIACGLSLAALFHCSVPAKEAQDEPSPITPGGPGLDAGRDADSQEVGQEPVPDADTRNALCGSSGCNPDEEDGAETCPSLGGAGAAGATSGNAQACRVTRGTTATGSVAVCGPAGAAVAQGACQAQTDCGAGLVCVGALGDTAGICRPYCCYGQGRCRDSGTYCTLVRAFEIGAGTDALRLPACVVPDNCRLLDPTSCDAPNVCTFLEGVTICFEPGKGRDGDPCSCASGYVCLESTNTCRRICHQGADQECGGGTCVSGGATFPEGFGVCSK